MKTFISIKNNSGASLLEVMIAMVILTVGFLGVMALSVALTNNNATAGKINTATAIAQAEVSQLNYIGETQGPANLEADFTSYLPSPSYGATQISTKCPSSFSGGICYEYEISPQDAPQAGSPAENVDNGVTLPYTVMFILNQNAAQTSSEVLNAVVEVCWQDGGLVCRLDGGGQYAQHLIVMNDVIS
ncbi:MAG: type IV pilus modification PilV family protein [Candidatus Acidulodesulfobacterium sp.]